MLQGMCCISLEITEHVGFEHMVPNVIGGEKVKTQPELEHRASGIPCQHSNIWAKKTWYTVLQTFHERMLLCSSDIV